MASERDTQSTQPDHAECVLLTDRAGTVRWASPNATAVFDSDPVRESETVRSLLGADAPDPAAVGADPVTRTVSDADGPALAVTAEAAAENGMTVYRCRPLVDDQLTVEDVLTRVDDAVVAFDTEWRYTYVNEAATDLLDQPAEALLGESVWDVFPDAEDSRIHEAMERALATQESETLEWFWAPTEQYLDVHCFPSESGVSLYFRNVTERKEREDALRRERDLTDQLLRVSPMGIAVHTPDRRFVRLNERAEELLGTDSQELLGTVLDEPSWEAYGPDGEPFPDEAFPLNVVLRTGESTFGTEMSLRRSDGTRFWLSVSAAPLLDERGEVERVVVTFEDITERRQYQRDLRESEQQFRAVFDGTLDALVLADDDGDYLEVNDAACDLYGLDEADLVGRNVAEFAPPEYDVAAAWTAFVEQGSMRGEFPLVRPDGEVRTADFAATADITPGIHLSALRDITERKADERQLAAQRDELDRLNSLNELIREVNRTVVGATDRATIREAVCDELVGSERYPFAIAARLTVADGMQVEYAAGLPADAVTTLRAEGASYMESAMRRAVTENSPTVLSGLGADGDHPEPLRSLAATHGVRAVANIPIAAESVVYGVLTVGARDETAFGDRERAVFLELGQLIGAAVDAIQTKKLLHESAHQQLKLAASARDAPLVAFHERLGEPLTVDGVVPVGSGDYLVYVTVETATDDVTRDTVAAAADGIDGIEAARYLAADSRPLVELTVGEATAVSALLDAGGRLQGATVEDRIGEFVVEVPLDTDVRMYLDRVERRGIDMGLLAKRDVERAEPETWSTDALTTRQRTVLEAAYRSGYFDWPRRRTTGEKLADSLGIASSTLHQHLRVATRKVLDDYFAGHAVGVR